MPLQSTGCSGAERASEGRRVVGERREEMARRDKVVLSLSLCAFQVLTGGEAAGSWGSPRCCSSRKSCAALAVSQSLPALPAVGGGAGRGGGVTRGLLARGTGRCSALAPGRGCVGARGLGSVSLPLPSAAVQDGADVHRGDAAAGPGPLPSLEQTLNWGQGQGEEERWPSFNPTRQSLRLLPRGAEGSRSSPVVNSSH